MIAQLPIHVENGRWKNQQVFWQYIRALNGDYFLILDEKAKKTNPQLGYIHAVHIPVYTQATGYYFEEARFWWKWDFGPHIPSTNRHGKAVEIPKSMADWSKEETGIAIETSTAELTSQGYFVPPPWTEEEEIL